MIFEKLMNKIAKNQNEIEKNNLKLVQNRF